MAGIKTRSSTSQTTRSARTKNYLKSNETDNASTKAKKVAKKKSGKLTKDKTVPFKMNECFVRLCDLSPEKKKIENNNVKKTKFAKCKSPSPLQLRTRRFVKYVESSLEMSNTKEQKENKKVPIYKQQANGEISLKRKTDQYEFDSDSDKYKKKKRRKLNSSSSDEYNQTIENIVKNVTNKVRKKNKRDIFTDKTQRVRKKARVVMKQETNNNINKKTTKVNKKIPVVLKSPKPPLGNKDKDKFVGPESPLKSPKITILNNIQLQPMKELNVSLQSPRLFKNGEPNANSSTIYIKKKPEEVNTKDLEIPHSPEPPSDNEEFFDFEAPLKSPKITILSNSQLEARKELNVSMQSPRLFKNGEPNANSTMLNNVLTPWRFNQINVRRNPHFLSLKPSSLPCINQEMVLDYTTVGKLNESMKTQTPKTNEKRKSRLQPTIVDYFSPKANDKENKENAEVSLYDVDQLSPIKNSSKVSRKIESVKRKILGEKTENVIESSRSSTPRHKKSESPVKRSNFTNFGFDDSDRENAPIKNKEDRPFRFSVNVNDKKYQRKKRIKLIEPAESEKESDDESSYEDAECESGEVKLFEDFQTTQDILEQREFNNVKRKKKSKLCNDEHRHRKRKDMRTKEEEEEAEQWAAKFNSMCEEVEQFPLEIE